MNLLTHYMNEEKRSFTRQQEVTLVDLRDRFLELLPIGVPRTEYFRTPTDGHPNARGYYEIAQLIADVFEPRSRTRSVAPLR